MRPGAVLRAWARRVALGGLVVAGSALAWAASAAPAASVTASAPASAAATTSATAASAPAGTAPVLTGQWTHALTAFTTPKYPANFQHYAYVNPAAPKGGTLRLANPDRRASIDKLNPFTIKGVAPAALEIFMFERLADFAQDEPQSMYGLLAEAMFVAPDLSFIRFRLHPKAKFSDGTAVTADDVVSSFQRLTGKLIESRYKTPLLGVAQAVAEDARTVRFDLKSRTLDAVFGVGYMPVFARRWGDGKPLDQIVNDRPITSGPYVIDQLEMPSRIEFKRNPDHWARDLPVRRGMFNFDRVAYRMYKDDAVRREAFKAGEFDLFRELTLSQYMRSHQGPKWRDGRILKKSWPVDTGNLLQSYNFNLRKAKFQDIRVREAIMRAYDFETVNRYGYFKRSNSLFANSDFAAKGLPSPAELALLAPFRAELPATVFGPAFEAPRTDTYPNALRDSLKQAAKLLSEAGWNIAPDGVLRNARGEAFTLEYIDPVRVGRAPEFARNLQKLGIQYNERLVDFALFRRKTEVFDFDIMIIVEGKFTLPPANDLEAIYHSKFADDKGSNNYRGVKSRAVDALLERLSQATTLDDLRTAASALDRVVMWNHWQIAQLHARSENTSYWAKFGIPDSQARYFSIDSIPNEHSLPWPLMTWWDKSLPLPASR